MAVCHTNCTLAVRLCPNCRLFLAKKKFSIEKWKTGGQCKDCIREKRVFPSVVDQTVYIRPVVVDAILKKCVASDFSEDGTTAICLCASDMVFGDDTTMIGGLPPYVVRLYSMVTGALLREVGPLEDTSVTGELARPENWRCVALTLAGDRVMVANWGHDSPVIAEFDGAGRVLSEVTCPGGSPARNWLRFYDGLLWGGGKKLLAWRMDGTVVPFAREIYGDFEGLGVGRSALYAANYGGEVCAIKRASCAAARGGGVLAITSIGMQKKLYMRHIAFASERLPDLGAATLAILLSTRTAAVPQLPVEIWMAILAHARAPHNRDDLRPGPGFAVRTRKGVMLHSDESWLPSKYDAVVNRHGNRVRQSQARTFRMYSFADADLQLSLNSTAWARGVWGGVCALSQPRAALFAIWGDELLPMLELAEDS